MSLSVPKWMVVKNIAEAEGDLSKAFKPHIDRFNRPVGLVVSEIGEGTELGNLLKASGDNVLSFAQIQFLPA